MKWRTLQPTTPIQVARVSHILGICAKSLSQIGGLCIKGKKATTKSSPIRHWSKDSTVGWYFEIGQGLFVRFLILVTAWLLISGFLREWP